MRPRNIGSAVDFQNVSGTVRHRQIQMDGSLPESVLRPRTPAILGIVQIILYFSIRNSDECVYGS